MLRIHLSRDFKVLVAQNATEALAQLQEHGDEVGLVVADQRMPGTTGTEFLVTVRKLYPDIERMIITAYADLPPIIEAINEGQISGFISKPWNPTEVRLLLQGGIERFCLRQSLKQADLRLMRSEQNNVLGVLAAGIGHEINNPANVLMFNLASITEALRPVRKAIEHAAPPDLDLLLDQLHEVDTCISESTSALHVITEVTRNLRTLCRLNGQPKLEATDVNEAIRSSLGFMKKQIAYRGTTQHDLRATRAAHANRAKLTQVLINLCTNAVHAIDDVTEERSGRIRISSWDDSSGYVVIEVEDNGPGVPKDVEARVFDPFFTTKNDRMGLGIGLTISKNIVEQMGGTIALHSSVGVGTRLVVRLPSVAEENPAEVAANDADRVSGGTACSILIIDDDERFCSALERMVRGKFEVDIKRDGKSGIAALRDRSFDVIMCDLMMPSPDGREVYEYIVQHKPDHVGRVVFMTGGAFTPRLKQFCEEIEGVVPILRKPFSFEELSAAIGDKAA